MMNGRPVLWYLKRHLNDYGISDITVNLHHKPMQFMSYFKDELQFVYEPKPLGEEETVSRFKKKNVDPFVVMNGDTLTNINIEKMYELADNKNIMSMENGIYTGTSIVFPNFTGKPTVFEDSKTKWLDVGTWQGLGKAGEFTKQLEAERAIEKGVN